MKAPNESVNQSYEIVGIDTVEPFPGNPRRGDLDAIKASIRAIGFRGALIVQKSTRHILVGNHRWQAAKDLGMTEVPIVLADIDDERARALVLSDNRTADLGSYDEAALDALLSEVGALPDLSLADLGFDDAEVEALHARVAGDFDQPTTRQTSGDASTQNLPGEDIVRLTFPFRPAERDLIVERLGTYKETQGLPTISAALLKLVESL